MQNVIGYKGLFGEETGRYINSEDAFGYALECIKEDAELQKEVVEWFYSGNYIAVNQEEN